MCRCHLTALRPTGRELRASAEGFTEGHTAAQFTERWCFVTIRAIPSTLEWVDTAPNISLHLPVAATTYNLSVTRHLTTTVSVRSAFAAASRRLKRPRRSLRPLGGNGWRGRRLQEIRLLPSTLLRRVTDAEDPRVPLVRGSSSPSVER